MNTGLNGLRKIAGLALLLGATGAAAQGGCGAYVPIVYAFSVFPSPIQRGASATLTLEVPRSAGGCGGHDGAGWYSGTYTWTGTTGVFSSGEGQQIRVTNFPAGPVSASFQYDDPGFYQPSFTGHLLYRLHITSWYPQPPLPERVTHMEFGLQAQTFTASTPLQVSLVPEPETYTMMLGGLGLVGWVLRRRKPQSGQTRLIAWGYPRP